MHSIPASTSRRSGEAGATRAKSSLRVRRALEPAARLRPFVEEPRHVGDEVLHHRQIGERRDLEPAVRRRPWRRACGRSSARGRSRSSRTSRTCRRGRRSGRRASDRCGAGCASRRRARSGSRAAAPRIPASAPDSPPRQTLTCSRLTSALPVTCRCHFQCPAAVRFRPARHRRRRHALDHDVDARRAPRGERALQRRRQIGRPRDVLAVRAERGGGLVVARGQQLAAVRALAAVGPSWIWCSAFQHASLPITATNGSPARTAVSNSAR